MSQIYKNSTIKKRGSGLEVWTDFLNVSTKFHDYNFLEKTE